jgi:hypothetical protein
MKEIILQESLKSSELFLSKGLVGLENALEIKNKKLEKVFRRDILAAQLCIRFCQGSLSGIIGKKADETVKEIKAKEIARDAWIREMNNPATTKNPNYKKSVNTISLEGVEVVNVEGDKFSESLGEITSKEIVWFNPTKIYKSTVVDDATGKKRGIEVRRKIKKSWNAKPKDKTPAHARIPWVDEFAPTVEPLHRFQPEPPLGETVEMIFVESGHENEFDLKNPEVYRAVLKTIPKQKTVGAKRAHAPGKYLEYMGIMDSPEMIAWREKFDAMNKALESNSSEEKEQDEYTLLA